MNSSGIAPAMTAGSSSNDKESTFVDLFPNAPRSPDFVTVQPGLAGPAELSPRAIAGSGQESTMPSDEDFVVVDEISTSTMETGEEVAIISGETVKGADAAASVAAQKGGAVILSLSEPRLQARTISGSIFAAMLLDQRNGELPNPFSLWTLPDRYVPPNAEGTHQTGGTSSGIDLPQNASLQDAPSTGNSMAMGKEMSRMEAAISQLTLKLGSLRTAIGNLTRLYGSSSK